MRVKKGPTIEKFCARFGVPESELIDHINCYINRPGEFPQLIESGLMEDTEEKRRDYILGYFKLRVDQSMTERVKREMIEEAA